MQPLRGDCRGAVPHVCVSGGNFNECGRPLCSQIMDRHMANPQTVECCPCRPCIFPLGFFGYFKKNRGASLWVAQCGVWGVHFHQGNGWGFRSRVQDLTQKRPTFTTFQKGPQLQDNTIQEGGPYLPAEVAWANPRRSLQLGCIFPDLKSCTISTLPSDDGGRDLGDLGSLVLSDPSDLDVNRRTL